MKKSLLIPLRYGTKRLRVATQIADPFMERPTAQRYDKGYRPAAFAVLAREVEEKDFITARTDRRFSVPRSKNTVFVIAFFNLKKF